VQIAQRGVAGAEVVEVEPDAECVQPRERLDDRPLALDEHTLGELEAEAARWQSALVERVRHPLDQIGMGELARREINADRDVARAGMLTLPFGEPAAGLPQHPVPHRDDQAGLLRDREEVVRRDEAALGMLPPHEGLHTGDATCAQRDDRLVEDAELVALERHAKVGLELQQRDGVGVHLLVEYFVA